MCRVMYAVALGTLLGGLSLGCGSSGETEADRAGVGAECTDSAECESPDEDIPLECQTRFAGGYCGLEGCEGDADCPDGSACVALQDVSGTANYCFRTCVDKAECNANRGAEEEAK